MAIDKQGISTGKTVRELVEDIENELLYSFRKRFVSAKDEAIDKVDWDKWRIDRMKEFDQFKHENRSIIKKYMKDVSKAMVNDFEESYRHGLNIVNKQIKQAAKKGLKFNPKNNIPVFTKKVRVLKELQKAQDTLNRAYTVAINSLESQFLQTIQKAQNQPLARTLFGAIDMANKELIRHGIVGAVTTNQRRLNIANYIEMTVIEASQEMLFIGEATKSEDVGIYTVYISQHRSSCPLCTPWQGKVLIDDVYQPGVPDGKHELLSVAIQKGLFHYNCRHNRITYIEGVDVMPDTEKNRLRGMSKREQEQLYQAEQLQRYNERKIREWKRAQVLALTPQEYQKASRKVAEYQARNRHLVKITDGLYRNYWREKPGFKVPVDVRWRNLKYDLKLVE